MAISFKGKFIMKYIILLMLLCSQLTATAQWEAQFVQEQGTTLYDVQLIKGEQGVAVGRLGTILKTNDGFRTWKRCATKNRKDLFCLVFFDSLIGIAIGSDGVMFRSTDGGDEWNLISSGVNDTLYSTIIISPTSAIAVGSKGRIIRTTDKGLHWETIASGTTLSLRNIAVRDSIAVAVGFNGAILRSEDLGSSWTAIESGTTKNLYTVSFATDTKLLTGGDSTIIYSSSDAGKTWIFDRILYGVINIFTQNSIRNILFVNDSIGYMCGYLSDVYAVDGYYPFMRILYTTNAGKTWSSLVGTNPDKPNDKYYDRLHNKSFQSYWYKIAVINPDSIIAVGADQTNLSSKIIAGGPNSPLFEIRLNEVTSAEMGYVTATPKDMMSIVAPSKSNWKVCTLTGELLQTNDAGNSWSSSIIGSGAKLFDMEFYENFGIMMGDSGRIYRTADGGNSWKLSILDRGVYFKSIAEPTFTGAVVLSPTTALINGSFGYRDKLLRTNNSGELWEKINVHTDTNVSYATPYFIDELHGWIFAQPHIVDSLNRRIGFKQGLLYYTTDGGITWIDRTPYSTIKGEDRFHPLKMYFTDKLHGCFTAFDQDSSTQLKSDGAYLFKTNDGGETWSRTPIDMKSVFGVDIVKFNLQNVDIIGIDSLDFILYLAYQYNSKVVRTMDGGFTWKIMTFNSAVPKYNISRAFYKTDPNTIFIIGYENTLYRWDIDKTVSSVSEQPAPSDGITISPNPVSTSFTISGIEGVTSVKILTSLGIEVKQLSMVNGQWSIDVSDLASGVYFVQFRSQTGVISKPIVVGR